MVCTGGLLTIKLTVIVRINVRGDSHLVQVAQALNAFGLRFGSGQRGKKQRREDCNDGNYYEGLIPFTRSTLINANRITYWRFFIPIKSQSENKSEN
jgi:hypothetical protein